MSDVEINAMWDGVFEAANALWAGVFSAALFGFVLGTWRRGLAYGLAYGAMTGFAMFVLVIPFFNQVLSVFPSLIRHPFI